MLMQLLQELSQVPCMADINFAKKASIMKRNRYKDRFPCECTIFKCPSMLRDQLNLIRANCVFIFTIELIIFSYAYSLDSTGYLHLPGKAGHEASKGVNGYYNASFLNVSCSNSLSIIQ